MDLTCQGIPVIFMFAGFHGMAIVPPIAGPVRACEDIKTRESLGFMLSSTTRAKPEALSAPVFSLHQFGRFLMRLADCALCDWRENIVSGSIGALRSLNDKPRSDSFTEEPQPCFRCR